jgi:hypothetical protein
MPLRLQDRDLRILRHVARYRLTTLETVWLCFFKAEGKSQEAAKSTLRRLWQDETPYLASQPLTGFGKAVYYHLTPEGAAALGFAEPKRIGHGFDKADVRAAHYGRLLFCCHGEPRRPKFTPEEFDACFPGLRAPGTELFARFFVDAYYLDVDPDGVQRLGLILVDTGRDLVDLARRTLGALRAALAEFFAAERMAVALVFASDHKLRHTRFALAAHPIDAGIRVVLEAQPALRDLLVTSTP